MSSNKFSPQTKSFIVLLALAVFGTYVCLSLWSDANPSLVDYYRPITSLQQTNAADQNTATLMENKVSNVDTSSWKTYQDKTVNLSFKYHPDWTVKPLKEKDGYQILEIDPGKKFYNIKIYISPSGYYALSGLPTKNDTIGGQTALNVNNMLYGVNTNGLYYTFDVGISLSLTPNFNALVHSVKFQ
jgi:hypothetical protein